MTILPKGGVLINIHTSLTVRVYNIHALQTLDNRIYVCMYVCMYVCISYSGVLEIYGSYSCEAEGVARGQATV